MRVLRDLVFLRCHTGTYIPQHDPSTRFSGWPPHAEHLRAFPDSARRRAGEELDLLQHGLEPHDFKPMPSIGAGVHALRIRAGGTFRVFFVATFAEGLYVLHAFQKTSQQTERLDVAIGAMRELTGRNSLASRRHASATSCVARSNASAWTR